MTSVCLILFLAVASLWFFANEYPTLFGVYVPARAVRRLYFKVIVAVFIILGVSVSAAGGVQGSLMSHVSPLRMDCQSLIIVLISSLIILSVLKRFRINASCVYAVLGALEAWMITSGNDTDYGLPVSFIVAPVVAFASGLNWGGFLAAGASLIAGSQSALCVTVTVLLLSVISLSPFMRDESDATAGKYSDFSIYAVLSVGYGVALTLLFFSFGGSAGLLGLKPVPLSVGSLVIASVAGVEVVKKSHLIERDEYAKEGLTLVFYGYVVRNRRQREATERLVYIQQQQIYENSRALNDMELKVVLSENQALHNSVEVKQRFGYMVNNTICEVGNVLNNGAKVVTINSESTEIEDIKKTIADCGLEGVENINYLQAIKRVIGMSDKPLANE